MGKSKGNSDRPSAFKQVNKQHKDKHKKIKHKKIKKETEGSTIVKKQIPLKKIDKINQKNQIRLNRNKKIKIEKSQFIGKNNLTPLHVAIIPLYVQRDITDLETIKNILINDTEEIKKHGKSAQNNFHINLPKLKARFSLHFLHSTDYDKTFEILDIAKIADFVVFVLPPINLDIKSVISNVDTPLLECLIGQGISNTLFLFEGHAYSMSTVKKTNIVEDYKKGFIRLYHELLIKYVPNPKIIPIDKKFNGINLYRQMVSHKRKIPVWLNHRSMMLADYIDVMDGNMESPSVTLKISGFIKQQSTPFLVNQHVHIPEMGDFKVEKVFSIYPDPYKTQIDSRSGSCNVLNGMHETMESDAGQNTMMDNIKTIIEQRSMPLDYYRLNPTDFDLLLASPVESSTHEPDEEEMVDESNDVAPSETASIAHVKINENVEVMSVEDSLSGWKEYKEQAKEKIPDGVDTPTDRLAKDRFSKYRGLKSFKQSAWENAALDVPPEYRDILDFENFAHTKKHAMAHLDKIYKGFEANSSNSSDGVNGDMEVDKLVDEGTAKSHVTMGGNKYSYYSIVIPGVPRDLYEKICVARERPVVVIGLLPYEQNVSLVNYTFRRSFNSPKGDRNYVAHSKERLLFQSGFRRFYNCPIFSQHTNDKKHKYEKVVKKDSTETYVCSMYTNITMSNVPLLVFKPSQDASERTSNNLIATASLLSIDPKRIIVKRAVLSGQPFKINGNMAVVRFMFYNTEDILWFKPIELHTKCGKHGHIKESVGTHGHMKCTFNAPIKSFDTVLMNLYKRMFPKWKQEPYLS